MEGFISAAALNRAGVCSQGFRCSFMRVTIWTISSFLVIAALGELRLAAAEPAEVRPPSTDGGTGQEVAIEAIVAEALQNNPELAFYEAEIAAARGERRSAGAWPNPELEVEVAELRAEMARVREELRTIREQLEPR